ncbi:MAG: type II toxin-antitoxin system VapC family toxin [Limisphaerales bacterium]
MGTGMKAVFDTNILVDYLGGSEAARGELARYRVRLISIITAIELMAGARDAREEAAIRGLLSSFEILDLSAEIAQEAIVIRKELRLKIPDAIVYATARTQGCLLVSRNTRELKSDWPDIRIPYQL